MTLRVIHKGRRIIIIKNQSCIFNNKIRPENVGMNTSLDPNPFHTKKKKEKQNNQTALQRFNNPFSALSVKIFQFTSFILSNKGCTYINWCSSCSNHPGLISGMLLHGNGSYTVSITFTHNPNVFLSWNITCTSQKPPSLLRTNYTFIVFSSFCFFFSKQIYLWTKNREMKYQNEEQSIKIGRICI